MSLKLIREALILVLDVKNPTSLTQAYRLLGGTTKPSQAVRKKMRELVPNVDELIARNKAKAEETKGEGAPQDGTAKFQTSTTSKSVNKIAKAGKYPHSQANPFRTNSNYALAFDVLAAYPDGLPLAEWRELYAKAAKKSLKLASFDTQVLLTAKDRPTSERHRSCRSGFYIERQCDHVTLKF